MTPKNAVAMSSIATTPVKPTDAMPEPEAALNQLELGFPIAVMLLCFLENSSRKEGDGQKIKKKIPPFCSLPATIHNKSSFSSLSLSHYMSASEWCFLFSRRAIYFSVAKKLIAVGSGKVRYLVEEALKKNFTK